MATTITTITIILLIITKTIKSVMIIPKGEMNITRNKVFKKVDNGNNNNNNIICPIRIWT